MSVLQRCVVFGLLVLLWLAGAERSAARPDITQSTMVARVGSDTITVYDLVFAAWNNRLLRSEPSRPPIDRLRSILEDLILDALIKQESEKMDLSNDWEFRNKERTVMSTVAAQLFQDEEFVYRLSIDSAAVDSYYHAHIDRFTVPRPQRHIRQITVFKTGYGIPDQYLSPIDTLYTGWDPKRKIDSLYQRLRDGESFTSLAALYSEEPRARNLYGDWGWISKDGMADTAFARFAFQQPLYRISRPYELSFGWVIVQVLGEREAGTTPFDAVVVSTIQNWLVQELGRGLATRLVDSLLEVADIVYLDDAIHRPDTLIQHGTPLAIINHIDTVRGFDYFMYKRNKPEYQAQFVLTEPERRSIVDEIVRAFAFFDALREWGYLDRLEVQEARRIEREHRGSDAIKLQFSPNLSADSAEIAEYYQKHLKEFTPDRRHQIYLNTFDNADSAKVAAERWRGGVPPANSQARAVNADDVPAAVWNRIASVTEGTIIGPLTVGNEYWVVQLHRIAQPRPLREVKGSIVSRIRDEKYKSRTREWVREMSKRYAVERRLDLLGEFVFPSREEASNEWFSDAAPRSEENR